ncbi:MAG TPA: Hsp20/alpha crystallin family protein [Desulfomicrobiaceae bacterium]|jgi:HSP20 family protein|nr:Hsp20/alpha crystallin family protein [Desulfomicrobiaceae bacterium]
MVIDFSSFHDLPRQMDAIFDEMWRSGEFGQRRMAYPPVNITEDEQSIYVSAEIPGMKIEDIDLTLTEGSLVIKGKRVPESGNYYRQERPTGNFQRVVNVNVPVNAEAVTASMKNGVLAVSLPKSEESRPRKISIAAQ